MRSSPRKNLPFILSLLTFILVGCGGGSSNTPPLAPTFTSTPVTSAVEGAQYSYQLAATSPDSSPITFSLTTAPSGATLSGNTISWTPTHAESRVPNSFTVTATTAAGASATQSWTVTPNGTVNITAVITYWTPSGSINVFPQWLANLPYPAALVPQSDGSLQRLQGAANADGSFSIPDVPAGYYWLQINPNANYWTTTSDFDFGQDVIGRPGAFSSQSTTTFNYSISGIIPSTTSGDYLAVQTDVRSIPRVPSLSFLQPNTTTLNSSVPVTSDIDWSKITTLYVSQYQRTTTGNFTGYLLGPSQTLSNIAFVNGATNPINAALSPSPAASLPLSITGTAWAALVPSVGPAGSGTPAPAFSDYAVFAQPYVTDRFALPTSELSLGPDLSLLTPTAPAVNSFPAPSPYTCGLSVGTSNFPLLNLGIAPILADVDYGTLSYGDPFPPAWLRMFQYCQISTVTLPRPNSTTVTDTFYVTNKQTTPLPSGPVTPLLTAVQSPMLNGNSLFQSATLSTTAVTISWSPPATGQPYGYFVSVYQLVTSLTGQTLYAPAGRYATAKTSVTIPFISAGGTYVFAVLAASDAHANIESSPLRHKIPTAESGVVSAPFVIQ
jgi:hypothetical protein